MMRAATARLVKLTEDEEAAALRALARQSMPQMPSIDEACRIGPAKRWFAVYTAPRAETKVLDALARQTITAYMPIAATWRKQSRKQKHQRQEKVRIERPVWPCYVFVALPVEMHISAADVSSGAKQCEIRAPFEMLRKVDGVSDIVGDGVRPLQVRPEFIDALRKREETGEFDDTVKRRRIIAPKWAVKDVLVAITKGPFAGFNAIIEAVLPHDFVKVCVFIFGRATPVDIEIDRIKRL